MRSDVALCRELLSDRRSDGELLAAFTAGPSEDAFAELVRRHGPLVWGACRRLLPNVSDAEDAFQASFLVLVRQASRLTTYSTIAPWLHRVAVWTARNVRRKNARRLARFTEIPEQVPEAPAPDLDLKGDLDAALLALPARYRDPILLCHLQGFTRREAAERLGCAEGTLSAWLSRGLEKLRHRLRGLDPAKALSVAAVSVPTVLTTNTAQAAVATIVAAASIPPAISVLVEGVLHVLWMKKTAAATFALCAVFALGVGVGLGTRVESSGVSAQDGGLPATAPTADPKPKGATADEIAALSFTVQTLEKKAELHRAYLDTLQRNLDLILKTSPDGKPRPEDVKAIAKAQAELSEIESELKVMRARLVQLKLVAKPPAAPPGNNADLDKKLVELRRQLELLQAERQQIEKLKKVADLKAAELELQLKKLLDEARALEAKRAAEANSPTPKTAYLEVILTSKDSLWPCRVTEFGPDGKSFGSLIAEDLTVLTPLFTRAAKDTNGPKEVRLTTQRDTPQARIRAVLEACKAAGIHRITIRDQQAGTAIPPGTPDDLKKSPPLPVVTLKEKADLEEYLNKLNKLAPRP